MKQSQKDLRILNKEAEMSLISLQGASQSPRLGVGESKGRASGGLRHKQSQFPPAELGEKGM